MNKTYQKRPYYLNKITPYIGVDLIMAKFLYEQTRDTHHPQTRAFMKRIIAKADAKNKTTASAAAAV